MPTETGIYSESEGIWGHRFSQKLCDNIQKILPQNCNVLDLGCGIGSYISQFEENGHPCLGVEGLYMEQHANRNIINQDLSRKCEFDFYGTVISLEVGEHIPKKYESTFLDNVTKHSDGMVVLSWAVVGQTGIGHVNCQDNDYIITKMNEQGFRYNGEISNFLRSDVEDECDYFRNTVMVFEKTI